MSEDNTVEVIERAAGVRAALMAGVEQLSEADLEQIAGGGATTISLNLKVTKGGPEGTITLTHTF